MVEEEKDDNQGMVFSDFSLKDMERGRDELTLAELDDYSPVSGVATLDSFEISFEPDEDVVESGGVGFVEDEEDVPEIIPKAEEVESLPEISGGDVEEEYLAGDLLDASKDIDERSSEIESVEVEVETASREEVLWDLVDDFEQEFSDEKLPDLEKSVVTPNLWEDESLVEDHPSDEGGHEVLPGHGEVIDDDVEKYLKEHAGDNALEADIEAFSDNEDSDIEVPDKIFNGLLGGELTQSDSYAEEDVDASLAGLIDDYRSDDDIDINIPDVDYAESSEEESLVEDELEADEDFEYLDFDSELPYAEWIPPEREGEYSINGDIHELAFLDVDYEEELDDDLENEFDDFEDEVVEGEESDEIEGLEDLLNSEFVAPSEGEGFGGVEVDESGVELASIYEAEKPKHKKKKKKVAKPEAPEIEEEEDGDLAAASESLDEMLAAEMTDFGAVDVPDFEGVLSEDEDLFAEFGSEDREDEDDDLLDLSSVEGVGETDSEEFAGFFDSDEDLDDGDFFGGSEYDEEEDEELAHSAENGDLSDYIPESPSDEVDVFGPIDTEELPGVDISSDSSELEQLFALEAEGGIPEGVEAEDFDSLADIVTLDQEVDAELEDDLDGMFAGGEIGEEDTEDDEFDFSAGANEDYDTTPLEDIGDEWGDGGLDDSDSEDWFDDEESEGSGVDFGGGEWGEKPEVDASEREEDIFGAEIDSDVESGVDTGDEREVKNKILYIAIDAYELAKRWLGKIPTSKDDLIACREGAKVELKGWKSASDFLLGKEVDKDEFTGSARVFYEKIKPLVNKFLKRNEEVEPEGLPTVAPEDLFTDDGSEEDIPNDGWGMGGVKIEEASNGLAPGDEPNWDDIIPGADAESDVDEEFDDDDYDDEDYNNEDEEEEFSLAAADMLMEEVVAEEQAKRLAEEGITADGEIDSRGFIGKLRVIRQHMRKWGKLLYKYIDGYVNFEENWWKLVDFLALLILAGAIAALISLHLWYN